ncbi:HugZ family protein [Amphritea sp. HPY]|uniref:HugZ family pyridoxamine 5'-phosphate oxidase n=1 Tax=Amphritea sp. HPY TaxID=3421652 RepID=UPI003D7D80C9
MTESVPAADAVSGLYRSLLENTRSLQLSSLKGDQPEASYAPFIREGRDLYIFVSELACHTSNLISHAKAGVMLIEDEGQAKNLFARKRITFNCQVEQVPTDSAEYPLLLDQMELRLGNTVSLLRSLPDFKLLRLVPVEGRFITGFGKAYDIDPLTDQLLHIDAQRIAGDKA